MYDVVFLMQNGKAAGKLRKQKKGKRFLSTCLFAPEAGCFSRNLLDDIVRISMIDEDYFEPSSHISF